MTMTDTTGEVQAMNKSCSNIAQKKYKTVARRTPIRSVPKPSRSRPTAIPIQNPEEERLAMYGVALRFRSMKETTQPEMAVSVPT
jgi:hypothetical protein